MTVTLATFMEVLDTSVANVSLPHIAGNLSEGIDAATWILTSYLVSNAVVLPLSSWISTRIGRKRFYMSCVALFTVSSFLCGIAPNLSLLIVFRILQGAGGGGLQPSEQAILADTFPAERRGMAFAIYGMAVVLAPAIGPTLGGYITDNASWRWIFFINVPVGIVSLLLTHHLVEDPPWIRRSRERHLPIDYVGLSLVVLGLGALQLVLDKGEREDWFASGTIIAGTVVASLALLATIVWECRHAHPVIDLKLLARRSFAAAFTMMFVLGLSLYGTTVLLPQYLQLLLGYTAEQAGKTLSPGGIVVMMLLPLVGKLLGKIDPRWLIGFGFAALSLSLFHMSGIYPGIDFKTAVMLRIYQSIGLAFLFVPINTVSYVGVPRDKYGEVSSLISLARNIGGSVGIALTQTLIARRAQAHQVRLVEHVSPLDPSFRRVLAGLQSLLERRGMAAAEATRAAYARIAAAVTEQATALAFIDVIWVLAILCALMLPTVLLVRKPPRGMATPAHRAGHA
jgi:DHA2 family multidrug resistance protein